MPTQGAVGMQEGNYIAEKDNAIKEIIEKQGNKALTRRMERDLVPGVNAFREAFIKWQQRRYKI